MPKIEATVDHPASIAGRPVFIVDGEPTEDIAGLRAAMALLEYDRATLAAICGVRKTTVDQWLADRRGVPTDAMLAVDQEIRRRKLS